MRDINLQIGIRTGSLDHILLHQRSARLLQGNMAFALMSTDLYQMMELVQETILIFH